MFLLQSTFLLLKYFIIFWHSHVSRWSVLTIKKCSYANCVSHCVNICLILFGHIWNCDTIIFVLSTVSFNKGLLACFTWLISSYFLYNMRELPLPLHLYQHLILSMLWAFTIVMNKGIHISLRTSDSNHLLSSTYWSLICFLFSNICLYFLTFYWICCPLIIIL